MFSQQTPFCPWSRASFPDLRPKNPHWGGQLLSRPSLLGNDYLNPDQFAVSCPCCPRHARVTTHPRGPVVAVPSTATQVRGPPPLPSSSQHLPSSPWLARVALGSAHRTEWLAPSCLDVTVLPPYQVTFWPLKLKDEQDTCIPSVPGSPGLVCGQGRLSTTKLGSRV